MVQGTTSDAGKSVFVAGLCRLLANQHLSVAPFKPQNMALNSAVTADGGEIGRSQALQAQACRLEPQTDFNPVLLKPSSDTDAQVIIHGQAMDSMEAKKFHDYKRIALNAVLESHERLKANFTQIIVEGAGSPAEINLRENDIANMGFAEAVDCPVVIIADIDKGGVFAHLVGTLELLSQSEQDRVIGFVINRFRGNIDLLEPGIGWLEQKTQKPVLAVLPYLQNFYLDSEDAINVEQAMSDKQVFNIIVPVLPRIGNHTDFDALRLHPDVNLQFIAIEAIENNLPQADLIILPGSKNTRADLEKLQQSGWKKFIQRHLRYGGKIIGICGGYQMLGNMIHDFDGIEDKPGSTEGFGLLDIETTLTKSKQLTQSKGIFIHPQFRDEWLTGYEIHCGRTVLSSDQQQRQLLQLKRKDHIQVHCDGAYNRDDNVIGTYMHGLFDQAEATNLFLQWAGFKSNAAVDLDEIRESQLNRLAETIQGCSRHGFVEQLLSQSTGQ